MKNSKERKAWESQPCEFIWQLAVVPKSSPSGITYILCFAPSPEKVSHPETFILKWI